MSDPFFFDKEKHSEEKPSKAAEKPSESPKTQVKLPKIEGTVPSPETKVKNPINLKDNKTQEGNYTTRQKNTAAIIYIALVISCLITIVGGIWAIFDLFMVSGKLAAFLDLSLGFQIAIVGAFLAGFFFLLIFFYGLSKKGIKVITKVTFKTREIEEKYKNKKGVKIIAGALMFSVFAIIIGIILSIILDLILGSTSTFSITNIFGAFGSTGPFVLFLGIFLLVLVGLTQILNWLWYNGYYLILRLVTDLQKGED